MAIQLPHGVNYTPSCICARTRRKPISQSARTSLFRRSRIASNKQECTGSHIISDDMSDDADVFRQVKCLYIRGNIISRKFANCSINVKLVVFKTYCSCLYTAQLWGTCLSRTMNRLKVAYNDSLRMVLGIPRYCSASEMFAYTNVPSCQCVIRLNIYSFMRRIQCTNNIIVRSIVNSDLIFSSLLWRNWRQRLFYIPNS